MTTYMCREPDTLPEEGSTCLIEQPPEQGGFTPGIRPAYLTFAKRVQGPGTGSRGDRTIYHRLP